MSFSKYFSVVRYLHKSLYFNFHYLRLRDAVKLPILFTSNVRFIDMRGYVRIRGKIRPGMIIFGLNGNALYQQSKVYCVWANHGGTCILSDQVYFCNGIAIEIGNNSTLDFEENVYLGPMVRIACFNNITVGANSRIAWESIILDTDFHSTIDISSQKSSTLSAPIVIGKNNWIGIRNFIMKGTTTPDFCVSSAYSLLNKSFRIPKYSLIGGVPAKFIKEGLFRDLSSHIFNNLLIVNADGFGKSVEINNAINDGILSKKISATSIMVNLFAFEHAISLAKVNNYEDKVGLHFNLTEGFPISQEIRSCRRLCDSKTGEFIYKHNSILFFTRQEKNAIKIEFESQLKRLKEYIPHVNRVDSHQHIHTEISIFKIICNTMKKENISIVRLSKDSRGLKNILNKRYNRYVKAKGFTTTNYISSYSADDYLAFERNTNSVELILHPIMRPDGSVYDVVEEKQIQYTINASIGFEYLIK